MKKMVTDIHYLHFLGIFAQCKKDIYDLHMTNSKHLTTDGHSTEIISCMNCQSIFQNKIKRHSNANACSQGLNHSAVVREHYE